jgi:hypothetical protein
MIFLVTKNISNDNGLEFEVWRHAQEKPVEVQIKLQQWK